MNRREFLQRSGATALAASTPHVFGALPKRPNILVIIADQLSMDALTSPARNGYIHTPNLDSLRIGGMCFTSAFASNPLCIPSRSAMFTGRYPIETGIQTNIENPRLNPEAFPCMGTIFRDGGYQTAYFGKWHLPYDVATPSSHGFEVVQAKVLDTATADATAAFLAQPHDKPFLTIASFLNPHNICEWARGQALNQGDIGAPPDPAKCPPLRPNHEDQKDEPDTMTAIRRSYQNAPMFPVGKWTDGKWRQYEWAYYRMIEKTDQQIGIVLKALKASGHEQETVVIFLADHGDCQGAHYWNQKTVFYEESIRVPLFIAQPGTIRPGATDSLVNTGIDLLPTLCDFAGIAAPHEHGLSLRPLAMQRERVSKHSYVVSTNMLAQGAPVDGVSLHPRGRMLRTAQYKYCVYSEGAHRESLVNLQQDPGEMQNLAMDPGHQHILQHHRGLLKQWSATMHDDFPYQT